MGLVSRRTLGVLAGVAVVVALVLGLTSGEATGLVVTGMFAVCVLVAHVLFTTVGPNAGPNRFHRRDLWQNERRVHRELRHHHREAEQEITPPAR
jgi:hypothetical protein